MSGWDCTKAFQLLMSGVKQDVCSYRSKEGSKQAVHMRCHDFCLTKITLALVLSILCISSWLVEEQKVMSVSFTDGSFTSDLYLIMALRKWGTLSACTAYLQPNEVKQTLYKFWNDTFRTFCLGSPAAKNVRWAKEDRWSKEALPM